MGDERREFSRVPLKLVGELACEGGRVIAGRVEDLSMNGVFLRTPGVAAGLSGCEGDLRLVFGEGDDALTIEARGRVRRECADGVGVEIVEVELESYHHLRSLVLHNAESFDTARDEIEQHQGLRRKDS